MNEYIARSGKNIGNKDHHSVPATLRKAKTFLEDEYLHEILAASDQKCFYFKAICYHSFRKKRSTTSTKACFVHKKGGRPRFWLHLHLAKWDFATTFKPWCSKSASSLNLNRKQQRIYRKRTMKILLWHALHSFRNGIKRAVEKILYPNL